MRLQVANATRPDETANALLTWLSQDRGALFIATDVSKAKVAAVREALAKHRSMASGKCHCLILETSGSTGAPKLVLLPSAALTASGEATAAALAGPGQWITALPLHHIAGLQTVLRSALAGHTPRLSLEHPFSPSSLAVTLRETRSAAPGVPLYLSLVSAQLVRCLRHADATSALAATDAILLGGGRLDPKLLHRAENAGLRVVTTYGMTETSGGCVYGGVPLPGCKAAVEEDGTILLSGPVLMDGYLNAPSPWEDRNGIRWLRTSDVGAIGEGGQLTVLARRDDILNTGGEKVSAARVKEILELQSAVRAAHVFGRPSEEWGQEVVAAVELSDGHQWLPQLEDRLRTAVKESLGGASAPRRFVSLARLPRTALGKVDGPAVARQAENKIRSGAQFRR